MNNLRCWLLISFVTFSVQACSPLGDPVNEAVSDNHFYNPDRSDILFCRMGNWFELGESSLNANVESFEVFNRLIAKDKDRIYFQSNPVRPSSIDLSSFYAKDNPDMYQIGFDKNHVYGFHMSRNWGEDAEVTLIKSADPNSYIQMDYEWGKDDSAYFYAYKKLFVDRKSFKMLNDYFSLDEDSAYYHSSKTFSSFEANVGTLKKIDRYLVYDDKNIYQLTTYYRGDNILELKAVPYSDISKVEFLEEVYIISDSNVYFKGFQLSEADDQTFEALGGYYSKDKNNVYFEDQIIPGGDAETFHFSKDNYQYTDKNGVYEQGKLVETTAEPTSL